jgi:hypothetical protein
MNQTVMNNIDYTVIDYRTNIDERSFNKGLMTGAILTVVCMWTVLFIIEIIKPTSSPDL